MNLKTINSLNSHRSSRGFTLIELMISVIIIGVLIAIAVPNFASMQMRAKISSSKNNARTVQVMAESFNMDHQYYPSSISDFTSHDAYKELANPITQKKGVSTWEGAWSSFPGSINLTSLSWSASKGKAIYMGYDMSDNPTVNINGKNIDGRRSDHYRILVMNDKGKNIKNFEITSQG